MDGSCEALAPSQSVVLQQAVRALGLGRWLGLFGPCFASCLACVMSRTEEAPAEQRRAKWVLRAFRDSSILGQRRSQLRLGRRGAPATGGLDCSSQASSAPKGSSLCGSFVFILLTISWEVVREPQETCKAHFCSESCATGGPQFEISRTVDVGETRQRQSWQRLSKPSSRLQGTGSQLSARKMQALLH